MTLGGPGRPRYSRTPAGAARTPAPPLRSALGRTRPAPSSASGGERAEGTPGRARQRQRRGVREEFGTHPLPRPAGKLRPGWRKGRGSGQEARGQGLGEVFWGWHGAPRGLFPCWRPRVLASGSLKLEQRNMPPATTRAGVRFVYSRPELQTFFHLFPLRWLPLPPPTFPGLPPSRRPQGWGREAGAIFPARHALPLSSASLSSAPLPVFLCVSDCA